MVPPVIVQALRSQPCCSNQNGSRIRFPVLIGQSTLAENV